MPENRFGIPEHITRRQRRANVVRMTKVLKYDMRIWKILETWFKTLSEEEKTQAVNFEHEDKEVNEKVKALAKLEQKIVRFAKALKDLQDRRKGKTPFVNGRNKEISAIRASIEG